MENQPQTISRAWPAACLVLAVLLIGSPGSAQSPKPASSTIKVGLVDLGVVFNQYYKKVTLEKEVNVLKKKWEDKIKKQRRLILDFNKEAEDLEGDKLEELLDRMDLERAKERIMQQRMKQQLRREIVKMTLTLLKDINDQIVTYGKTHSYTFILKLDNQGFGRDEFREKIFRAQVQSVLFHSSGIEITKPILAVINAKRKTKKAGK